MTVVMERHGKDLTIGKINAKVPTDRSVLSIIGDNPIYNKSEFRKDWWIYVNGKKFRKWFMRVYDAEGSGNVLVWPPALKNIPQLEARYWKINEHIDKFINEKLNPITKELQEAKTAHAIPTHKYNGPKGAWLYTTKNGYISFGWVDIPKKLINPQLGQKYYEIERRFTQYCGYRFKFRIALERAIGKYLDNNPPTGYRQTLALTINDRIYWYKSIMYRHDFRAWKKLHWPSDTLIQISLSDENWS